MASNKNEETKTLVEIHEMKMKGYHLVQWKQWKRVVASDQGYLLKDIVIWFVRREGLLKEYFLRFSFQ